MSLKLLDSLSCATEAARDQTLQIARTAKDLKEGADSYEQLKAISSLLECEALDVQIRLQAIQDAAIKLGANRPSRTARTPMPDLHPIDIPSARRLLDALSNVAEAARDLDEEMGWLDENGKPIGYYERYSLLHLLFESDLEAGRQN